METQSPKSKFSVMPVLLALFTSVMHLPALNVFRVNTRGLGDVHAHPGQIRTAGRISRLAEAMTRLGAICRRLAGLSRHPLFRPAAALGALVLALVFNIHAALAAPAIFGVLTEGTRTAEFLISELEGVAAPSREAITVLSGQNLAAGAVVGRVTLGIGRVSIPAVVGTGNGTATAVFAGPDVLVGNYVVTCSVAAANAGTFTVTNPAGNVLPTATVGTAYTSREINFTLNDGSTDFIVTDAFTFVVSTTVPTVIGGTGNGVLSALSLGPDAKPGRYKINNDVVVANGGDMSVIGPDGSDVGGRFVWSASGSTAAFTSRQINFTISDSTDYIANNYFDICVFNQLNGGKVAAWDPTTFDGRHKAVGALYAAVNAASADTTGVIVNRDAAFQKNALSWAAAITSAQKESAYADLLKRGIVCRDGVTV